MKETVPNLVVWTAVTELGKTLDIRENMRNFAFEIQKKHDLLKKYIDGSLGDFTGRIEKNKNTAFTI